MGKYVALAIGLARAGSLPELPGAVNGAKEFHDWASLHDYETHLITDESGEVTTHKLKAKIKAIIDDGKTERLVIYFAGHGIQPSVNTTYWLLSGWEADSDEAVNVNLSLSNAKRSGVSQIAVFADACRSTVPDGASVGGSSIFPKAAAAVGKLPQWDEFLASRLGESAQEVSARDPMEAYGIFTRCVIRALTGGAEKAIIKRPYGVVTSDSLANYLEEVVPLESGKIPGAVVQFPEVNPGWRSPNDIYVKASRGTIKFFNTQRGFGFIEPEDGSKNVFFHATALERAGLGPLREGENVTFDIVADPKAGTSAAGRVSPSAANTPQYSSQTRKAVTDAERANEMAAKESEATYAFAVSQAQSSLGIRHGLTLVGCEPVSATVRQGERVDLFTKNSTANIRAHGEEPLSVLIELSDGNWIGACILPQFVGTVVVKDGLAASLNYAPAGESFDQDAYAQSATVLNRWTALMHQGRFGDYKQLRDSERVNLSLGILAAYAHERTGDFAAINGITIADYFAESPAMRSQSVIFDVALLSTKPILVSRRGFAGLTVVTEAGPRSVAGSFPLMTQGWSFLDREDAFVSSALFEVRDGLLPALWTTLRNKEGKRLAELLYQGEI